MYLVIANKLILAAESIVAGRASNDTHFSLTAPALIARKAA